MQWCNTTSCGCGAGVQGSESVCWGCWGLPYLKSLLVSKISSKMNCKEYVVSEIFPKETVCFVSWAFWKILGMPAVSTKLCSSSLESNEPHISKQIKLFKMCRSWKEWRSSGEERECEKEGSVYWRGWRPVHWPRNRIEHHDSYAQYYYQNYLLDLINLLKFSLLLW